MQTLLGTKSPLPADTLPEVQVALLEDKTRLRFENLISKTEGCWQWLGYGNPYGRFKVKGHGLVAHRVSYIMSGRVIPEGLTLDHLCKNILCVNPAHLEPVTMRENLRRGNGISSIHSRRTHCARGHELSGNNIRGGKYGRRCKVCQSIANAAKYRAWKLANPHGDTATWACKSDAKRKRGRR